MTSQKIRKTVFLAVMIAFSLLMLYPLLWMISSSFKPERIIFTDKRLWIAEFTWDNYIQGWEGIGGVPFIIF